jgi:ribosomal protein S18 acetylase RimI-like enzyme
MAPPGRGRALVAAFLALARAEGNAKMWLFTSEDNKAAKGLYVNMGGGLSMHDDAGYWWRLD